MFATLSAILHLGNMEISEDKDGNAAVGNDKHFQVQFKFFNISGLILT